MAWGIPDGATSVAGSDAAWDVAANVSGPASLNDKALGDVTEAGLSGTAGRETRGPAGSVRFDPAPVRAPSLLNAVAVAEAGRWISAFGGRLIAAIRACEATSGAARVSLGTPCPIAAWTSCAASEPDA
jgi:hypothetical protein